MFFFIDKEGKNIHKNVHVRPHISKLSLFFFLRPRNAFIIFLSNPKAIYSILKCFNDRLPSIEYQLPLPDLTSAASSPCGRAGQATWKSRCEKMTLDLTTTQAEFKLISRKARIWPCLDDRQVKWFYHAAETEGTAKGGGRVEDIKTPVGKLFVLLCFYVQDIRNRMSYNVCSFLCVFCAFESVQMCFYLSWGHQYSAVYNCVCFSSV